MKNLRENGYIEVDSSGYITLLDSGRQIAEKIYERHTTLSKWLVSLGVDAKTAAEDAAELSILFQAKALKQLKRLQKYNQI